LKKRTYSITEKREGEDNNFMPNWRQRKKRARNHLKNKEERGALLMFVGRSVLLREKAQSIMARKAISMEGINDPDLSSWFSRPPEPVRNRKRALQKGTGNAWRAEDRRVQRTRE